MIDDLWYKNTIIYSLDLETFMDSDGDGIGDFEGLIRRLNYLHSLGVGAIWLAPFQRTPNRDNGYDISDFYLVDPRHGTGGDFVEFLHQAHHLGIRVIMDLVVNHTSDQHPWFQESRSSPSAKRRDWYIWSKKRPPDWNEGMVFPGVQERTWTYDKKAGAYYYHRFYHFQPELNLDNPDVRTEIRRIMGYWLELGVSGFRLDAVPFTIESKKPGEEPEQRFEHLTEMRRFLQWRCRDGILLGEANVLPGQTASYFGQHDDGMQMMFNFFVNQHLFYALATEDVTSLAEALEATAHVPQRAQWAHFLRNHDELDLGRLTDEQRAVVFERFGPEKKMQIYGRGIRRRLASMLGDHRQIEFAYSALFALPGTPVLRYGDEIGMGDNLKLKERNAVRTPMQWSSEPQAGFSTSSKTVHPVIEQGVHGYPDVNVDQQRRDPDSLLNWTAAMIRLRKECPEVGWGDWRILKTNSSAVLALEYTWRGNTLVTVHNFSGQPREVQLQTDASRYARLVDLRVDAESMADARGRHRVVLESHGYRWYRAGSGDEAIRRKRD